MTVLVKIHVFWTMAPWLLVRFGGIFLIPSLQYVPAVLLLNFEDPIVIGNKLFRKYLIFYQSRRRHIPGNFRLYAQYLFSATKRSE